MLNEKVDWLLMDDELATRSARLLNLRVSPASYLLIYWTKKGSIHSSGALQMLDDLVKSGYRLSMKDYVSIRELIS